MADVLEEIARKIDALDMWGRIPPCAFAVRPAGTVLPYFCVFLEGDGAPVRARLLLLEGWQTFHDFVRLHHASDFGFASSPAELPQFALVVLSSGEAKVFRHDTGYVPVPVPEAQTDVCRRLLWEVYGVMLRLESDARLTMAYAGEQAMFSRVEAPAGAWSDAPLPLVHPRPHVERIALSKADVARAKDLPFDADEALELDFRLMPGVMTREKRPRSVYQLAAVDARTGESAFVARMSVSPDGGLRGMWESLAPEVLRRLIGRGRVPGALRLVSGRVFRMLRPLGEELPFKLSLHDALPRLEAAFGSA